MKNFTTIEGDFNSGTLEGQLSKIDKEVPKNKRLCPEINHLTTNQQKERNQQNKI
jgi:hypothetical protein